jgi:hypothetical protein
MIGFGWHGLHRPGTVVVVLYEATFSLALLVGHLGLHLFIVVVLLE